jgi:coiled-coil domain-containing protein 12
MASTHTSLDAAATERKTRLAKLKSLKRKQPDTHNEVDESATTNEASSNVLQANNEIPSVTTTYLSGRNYDPTTRGPKLGFEQAPTEDLETLEDRAAQIAEETTQQAEQEEKEDKPINLFKLQPKKPNWDLKRDLAKKMEILNVRTDNAIARLVRERIEGAKKTSGAQDGDVGMRGEELVEGMHVREREAEADERREKEEEEML